MNRMRAALGAVAVAATLASPAWAQLPTLTDPATLHIGTGWDTSCPTGATGTAPCGNAYSGEAVPLGSRQLDIYQNSAGAGPTQDPLLILAVPYQAAGSPTTSLLGSATLYPGATTGPGTSVRVINGPAISNYNLSSANYQNQSIGYVGKWNTTNSTAGTDIYSFLNLTPPTDKSNKLGSYLSMDQAKLTSLGTPAGYDIYIYGFSTQSLTPGFTGNAALNVNFASSLPLGSFAVAYAQTSTKLFDTPFTQAGIDLPEPGSLSVFGIGVVGLLASSLRRRRRRG